MSNRERKINRKSRETGYPDWITLGMFIKMLNFGDSYQWVDWFIEE